jgi:GrpB-like predicted nucleotidyltransferase (UPF0157 family)
MSADEAWVEVRPHDTRWAAQYEVAAAAILEQLGDYALGIEHFGSTAVPGLDAKPIVDILIGAVPGCSPAPAIEALARLGYEYLGEDGRRPGRFFWRSRGTVATNVSVVPFRGELWNANLAVRDFLRSSPNWARRYAEVKHSAAAGSNGSMLEYQDRKRAAVDELRAAALAWANEAACSAAPIAAITVQFHPDWPHGNAMVIDSIVADGYYRSQFVTGVSNGGLTAFPGGDRWRWESRLFDGKYDKQPDTSRPVYGAWNRNADPYGGAIRFGSCYLRLRPEAVGRATFCFPDSYLDPVDVGDATLLPRLCRMADDSGFDALDDCVEAHVHGPLRVDRDVEAIVLDPCFAGTQVEAVAQQLGCPVEFHPGFVASPKSFEADYRGAEIVTLARELGDELTPIIVGEAARTGRYPGQSIKQVWHCLARYGRTG